MFLFFVFVLVVFLLFYASNNIEIIRLDAIGFLWKELGTSCFHLDKTHEIVKLFRDVLDEVAGYIVLITETNVPYDDNISYFGENDEADMVYQFSYPPLVLDAFFVVVLDRAAVAVAIMSLL